MSPLTRVLLVWLGLFLLGIGASAWKDRSERLVYGVIAVVLLILGIGSLLAAIAPADSAAVNGLGSALTVQPLESGRGAATGRWPVLW